jgi:hypothetical protein
LGLNGVPFLHTVDLSIRYRLFSHKIQSLPYCQGGLPKANLNVILNDVIKLKRFFLMLPVLSMAVTLSAPAICAEEEPGRDKYAYGMKGPGRGIGSGYMMDDDPRCYGMHGRGHAYMEPHAWQSMKPEQREKREKMRAAHLMDTLQLRKRLATKTIELKTRWAQPKVDEEKVEKLAGGVTELETEFMTK